MSTDRAWHENFPEPRNKTPIHISKEGVLRRLQAGNTHGKDYLLVDLRRNDHEGGTIQGSLNLPAQSLHYSLRTLLSLCQSGGIKEVIWYCGESCPVATHSDSERCKLGSSRARGPRAAGWFDDAIQEAGVRGVQSLILEGGIKGWATAGPVYTKMMQGYDEAVWKREAE